MAVALQVVRGDEVSPAELGHVSTSQGGRTPVRQGRDPETVPGSGRAGLVSALPATGVPGVEGEGLVCVLGPAGDGCDGPVTVRVVDGAEAPVWACAAHVVERRIAPGDVVARIAVAVDGEVCGGCEGAGLVPGAGGSALGLCGCGDFTPPGWEYVRLGSFEASDPAWSGQGGMPWRDEV